MSRTDATEQPEMGILAISTGMMGAGALAAALGDARTGGLAVSLGFCGTVGGLLLLYAQKRGVL